MHKSASDGTATGPARPPTLVAGLTGAAWLAPGGESEALDLRAAGARARRGPAPLLCHLPATARRLGIGTFPCWDILELYAFVRPARFCLPTPRGLAAALDLESPESLADEAALLRRAARRLLEILAAEEGDRENTAATARAMRDGAWQWGDVVLAALGAKGSTLEHGGTALALTGLEIWHQLREWPESAPPPPPGHHAVEPAEARARLAELLGPDAEARPQQADYASAVAAAFAPRAEEDAPNMVLAEAGTGVGKTLGYIAPASLWAEKNGGTVWISTFTRNLQHQIDQEFDRCYSDPAEKSRKVVIRKGRENYLCLLNLEDAVSAARIKSQDAVALGLMARWAAASRDGAMVGGDFPGWLPDLVGRGRVAGLTDRRGECIYSACRHYTRCFIERSVRDARRADIVIANHALVMIQAVRGGDERYRPTRIVFDEGQHVFSAADNTFAGHLTGREGAELRRWLRGAEDTSRAGGGGRGRARGLKARIGDLVEGDEAAEKALAQALRAAAALPGPGWLARIGQGAPAGAAETFLAAVRQQVYARAKEADSQYGIETECAPLGDGVAEAARALDGVLEALVRPLLGLARRLADLLDENAAELETETRNRIDSVCRGLKRRAEEEIGGWRQMLGALGGDRPAEFVDWFAVERGAGREVDVGFHRHWIDPTAPFARTVVAPAHGVVVTSATLRDGSGDEEADWRAAESRTGAAHLPRPAIRAALLSPFDYGAQTLALVVSDVQKGDPAQVSAAMRELFVAAGGGALGLFTAIARLRAVHERIAAPLEEAGLPLLAQHVDGLDLSSLIDIFRAEENSCLLGTDALRDGVDVPGRSLRLIVFERVPWPRPDILHRARKAEFGAAAYDDAITRLRIKQAYGRLIRRADDRGVFVMLDRAMPSRLAGAFPEGVELSRIGLAEAVRRTREFLAPEPTHA